MECRWAVAAWRYIQVARRRCPPSHPRECFTGKSQEAPAALAPGRNGHANSVRARAAARGTRLPNRLFSVERLSRCQTAAFPESPTSCLPRVVFCARFCLLKPRGLPRGDSRIHEGSRPGDSCIRLQFVDGCPADAARRHDTRPDRRAGRPQYVVVVGRRFAQPSLGACLPWSHLRDFCRRQGGFLSLEWEGNYQVQPFRTEHPGRICGKSSRFVTCKRGTF